MDASKGKATAIDENKIDARWRAQGNKFLEPTIVNSYLLIFILPGSPAKLESKGILRPSGAIFGELGPLLLHCNV